ncbi:MAG: enoyl-CoA hydratase/isomerase family protein [Pseudomonadales bacterium]
MSGKASEKTPGKASEKVTEAPVLFEERPASNGKFVAIATLNVEKTLNSLSLEMTDMLLEKLAAWRSDAKVCMLLIQGAGQKAFCAGGDIQALYRSMVEHPGGPNPYAELFFEREYRLDYMIHTYPKPVMVWGHGFVMGGGLGVFGGCSHRICTERTRIALPEITIGLFPDAGASVFLNNMPYYLARFMALTGCQINGQDALKVGLAEHLIPNDKKPDVVAALTDINWGDIGEENAGKLTALLAGFENVTDFPDGQLSAHSELIQGLMLECNASSVLADFERALSKIDTDDTWLQRAIDTFLGGCPTTAHIVIEQLQRTADLSLEDRFSLELTIAVQCTRTGEFAEGVRALLIDKDNRAKWQYPERDAVPTSWVNEHFVEKWTDGNPLQDLG